MRQNQKLLAKSKKLWVVTKVGAQEDIQPLLQWCEGKELFIPALRQKGFKLLDDDVPLKTKRKKDKKN